MCFAAVPSHSCLEPYPCSTSEPVIGGDMGGGRAGTPGARTRVSSFSSWSVGPCGESLLPCPFPRHSLFSGEEGLLDLPFPGFFRPGPSSIM